jgi:hypothetical protein
MGFALHPSRSRTSREHQASLKPGRNSGSRSSQAPRLPFRLPKAGSTRARQRGNPWLLRLALIRSISLRTPLPAGWMSIRLRHFLTLSSFPRLLAAALGTTRDEG